MVYKANGMTVKTMHVIETADSWLKTFLKDTEKNCFFFYVLQLRVP